LIIENKNRFQEGILREMIKKYLKLYLEFTKQNIKTLLEYRVDFIIGVLSNMAFQLTGILFIWVVFQNINKINGWSFYEVTFLYGIVALCRSACGMFFDNLWEFGYSYIHKGQFDIVLLRPISALFQIIASRFVLESSGEILIALIIVLKSAYELRIPLTFINITMLIIFIFSGTVIFASIAIAACTSGFWTRNSGTVIWAIFSASEITQYPLTIYNRFIKTFFTWILPFGFISFYPINFFINKGYFYLSFLSPFVAIVLWFIALRVWNFGLKNYTSTGS
jgi:ABC-2 type transport system permease protein